VLRSSQDKFVELLPKTYSSSSGSYLDEVNKDSDLYRFLGGMAFTLDESLTYADLLKPDFDASTLNPNLVTAQAKMFNFSEESWLNLHSQKRLIRDAIFIYKNKGTLNAINSAVEGYSGYSSTITVSPNLLLNHQDSSFYKGIGNWKSSGCTLTSVTSQATPTGVTYAIDKSYTGSVVVASVNATLNLGNDTPNLTGVPIKGGTTYSFFSYIKSPSATGNVTVTIRWYDYAGNLISSATPDVNATTSSWVKNEFTATAPGLEFDVIEAELVDDVITLTTSEAHGLATGDVVVVSDLGFPFNGKVTLTAGSGTTMTYDAPSAGLDDIDPELTVGTVSEIKAVFAGIEVKFAAVGTYYLDMIQFADDSDSRSGDFYEARAVETYLAPTKLNYINNPSFENDLDSWTFDASATATSIVETIKVTPGGTHVAQVVTDGTVTTSSAPLVKWEGTGLLEPDQHYTFSIWAKAAASITQNLSLSIFNADAAVGGATRTHFQPMPLTTAWQRFQVKLFIPSFMLKDTSVVTVKIYDVDGADESAGTTIKLDSAQLESGYGATDYFDGDLPLWGASWLGTARDSTSMLYRKFEEKTGRVVRELPNLLPLNTPWYVTTGPLDLKSLDFKGFTS
jgi:hypothetical protein